MKVKYKRYKTAKSLIESHLEMPIAEFSEVGGFDNKGTTVNISMNDFVNEVKKQGYWGWAVSEAQEIHFWISNDSEAPFNEIVCFFAHELGHLQRRFKRSLLEEELRADSYALVCNEAIRQTNRVLKTRKQKRPKNEYIQGRGSKNRRS